MATYTSNYGWTKPSGSDNVDISVLNDNLDDQDSTIHDAFLNMAPPFSESSTYAVDDIVLYTTGLYKCHTAVVTPGSWTGSTNWQVYKLSEGGSGGGGTSNYNDLTNKPSINGVTLSGNKTTSDLGIDKTAVGLGNVPNVSTNDQTPTFTEASTRNNIASGEKLSVILGKVQKFFNDLKTVAFSGSFTDLTNKPENANTFQGTIAEWNQLTTAEKKVYDHASLTGAGGGEYNVDKTTGDLVPTAGMPSEYPATQVMMSDGTTSVEDAITEYGISTYDSKLHYKIFDPLMIMSGYFTGNGGSTIDFGIGGYMGIVNVRSTGDGTMGIYLINNGVINGWDGSTSRVFTNDVSYMISGVLHKVVP